MREGGGTSKQRFFSLHFKKLFILIFLGLEYFRWNVYPHTCWAK